MSSPGDRRLDRHLRRLDGARRGGCGLEPRHRPSRPASRGRIRRSPPSTRVCAREGRRADPNQPMGVFLFVGPSGVGKTELAIALSDLLFGGERFLITINMSEFQEKHTVSKLVGSPPAMSATARRTSDGSGAPAALFRRAARRGREGRSRGDEPLLSSVRQGRAVRRRRPRHRLQEHHRHPDEQPRISRPIS